MSLFTKNKDFKVQGLILKLLNKNCPALKNQLEDDRTDSRVNLSLVVVIVPIEDGEIHVERAFTAVTKDFSTTGLAIVMEQQPELNQVIVGFELEGEMAFILSEAKHLHPMGGGLFQLGLRFLDVVSTGDYPGLGGVSF
jgi:hypothetical protein